jgi:alpha-mannosidase
MYVGHNFLKREFGVTPKIGWMIDSFGHSSANAALFADFGFDALFMSRIDDDERNQRKSKEEMQFIWRPFSKHFGN